jgi:hypothetical protein
MCCARILMPYRDLLRQYLSLLSLTGAVPRSQNHPAPAAGMQMVGSALNLSWNRDAGDTLLHETCRPIRANLFIQFLHNISGHGDPHRMRLWPLWSVRRGLPGASAGNSRWISVLTRWKRSRLRQCLRFRGRSTNHQGEDRPSMSCLVRPDASIQTGPSSPCWLHNMQGGSS